MCECVNVRMYWLMFYCSIVNKALKCATQQMFNSSTTEGHIKIKNRIEAWFYIKNICLVHSNGHQCIYSFALLHIRIFTHLLIRAFTHSHIHSSSHLANHAKHNYAEYNKRDKYVLVIFFDKEGKGRKSHTYNGCGDQNYYTKLNNGCAIQLCNSL